MNLMQNIRMMIEDTTDRLPTSSPPRPSTPGSIASTAVVDPPTPPQNATPSALKGLIIPPFPPRNPLDYLVSRILPTQMTLEEASTPRDEIFHLLDGFEYVAIYQTIINPPKSLNRGAPFTVQRVCELVIRPREHYSSLGKYLRALEKTLLVTSTWDEYRFDTYAEDPSSPAWVNQLSNEALSHATTPIFSPIPFLSQHSESRSPPPPSPLALDHGAPLPEVSGTIEGDENVPPAGMPMSVVRSLRVDELDVKDSDATNVSLETGLPESPFMQPRMAEHPHSFSATTTVPSSIGETARVGGI